MKSFFILLFTIAFIPLSAQLRLLQIDDFEDYEIALKSAQDNENLLLVCLHNGGTELRKMYQDGVFSDMGLLNAAKAYTSIAIDVNEPMGERFTKLFVPENLPMFYLMNKDEFVLEQLEGYQSAAQLSKAMQESALEPYRYDTLLLGYQAHALNDAEWIELLELYSYNFDFRATTRIAQQFLNRKSEAELLEKNTAIILSEYGLNLETIYPQFVINRAEQILTIVPGFKLKDFLNTAIDFNLNLAISSGDSLLCENICESLVIAPVVKADSLREKRLTIRKIFAYESGRFQLYAQDFMKMMDRQAPSVASNLLYDEAYQLVEKFNEASALSAAMLLATKSTQKQASFRAHMLQAYIAYLQKDNSSAKGFLLEARKQIKNPEQLRNLDKLQALVEAAEKEAKD